jgi:predicted DNA-binding WGR domain protein
VLHLLTDGTDFYLRSTWWQVGHNAQASIPERVKGKNEGRSNATSDKEQATLEFDALVKKRRDKGFSEDGGSPHHRRQPAQS